ncbi:MAG TPA: conjugal transfer protein TraF [Syntrophorhabdaceae bacterium]|nr:hypothetical protein [Syntrophorhabdaceae bacterium]MDI9560219.1 conjugal transfer protein TraF [Pseudomonadota bacterium]HOS58866.1 conjugal transfer protein TraF [Syntrophorhabdaceae bacterium]
MKKLLILYFSILIGITIYLPAADCQVLTNAEADDVYSDNNTDSTAATVTKTQTEYYKDQKRGWYWNEKIPEPDKKKKKERKKVVDENSKKRFIPDMKDYTTEQLWNMHPDDFQDLLLAFHKKSVMAPTESNVKDYIYMQDIARRKSLAVTNVTAYVTQKYPEYNMVQDYPTALPGRGAMTRQQVAEVKDGIFRAKGKYGILYFYSPECEYCKEQSGILKYFIDKYGWDIKQVNINENPSVAARFNAQTVPYVVLVSRDKQDYMPISVGVVALDDMEYRLYKGVKLLSGEITPEEYSIYDYQKGGTLDITVPIKQGKKVRESKKD